MALAVKFNTKKHLFSFLISLVLLFSLNLHTFASSSVTLNFYNQPFMVLSSEGDITSKTVVSEGTYNGVHYTKFHFPNGTTYSKVLTTGRDSFNLFTDTTYSYSIQTESATADYSLNILLYLYDSQNQVVKSYVLADGVFPDNSASDGSYVVNHHTGSVYIEALPQVSSYAVLIAMGDGNSVDPSYLTSLFLYDMTFTATGPYYGSVVTPENLDDLDGTMDSYDELVNSISTLNPDDVHSIMNFDFNSFTSGMDFIKNLFDQITFTCNFSSIILFSLTMGLACMILGRKARG